MVNMWLGRSEQGRHEICVREDNYANQCATQCMERVVVAIRASCSSLSGLCTAELVPFQGTEGQQRYEHMHELLSVLRRDERTVLAPLASDAKSRVAPWEKGFGSCFLPRFEHGMLRTDFPSASESIARIYGECDSACLQDRHRLFGRRGNWTGMPLVAFVQSLLDGLHVDVEFNPVCQCALVWRCKTLPQLSLGEGHLASWSGATRH